MGLRKEKFADRRSSPDRRLNHPSAKTLDRPGFIGGVGKEKKL
jgi:hypothetical protein